MPAELGDAGRELWTKLTAAYSLDDAHAVAVLAVACRCADRAESCRVAIDRDGVSVTDRWGQTKPNPLLAAERDARSGLLAAIRQLALPLEI